MHPSLPPFYHHSFLFHSNASDTPSPITILEDMHTHPLPKRRKLFLQNEKTCPNPHLKHDDSVNRRVAQNNTSSKPHSDTCCCCYRLSLPSILQPCARFASDSCCHFVSCSLIPLIGVTSSFVVCVQGHAKEGRHHMVPTPFSLLSH